MGRRRYAIPGRQGSPPASCDAQSQVRLATQTDQPAGTATPSAACRLRHSVHLVSGVLKERSGVRMLLGRDLGTTLGLVAALAPRAPRTARGAGGDPGAPRAAARRALPADRPRDADVGRAPPHLRTQRVSFALFTTICTGPNIDAGARNGTGVRGRHVLIGRALTDGRRKPPPEPTGSRVLRLVGPGAKACAAEGTTGASWRGIRPTVAGRGWGPDSP